MIENFEASRRAVHYLTELGHQRIGYIGDRFGYGSDSERFSGYRAALDEAGLPFRPELVVHGDGKAELAMKTAPGTIYGQEFLAYEENGRMIYQDEGGLMDLTPPRLPGEIPGRKS